MDPAPVMFAPDDVLVAGIPPLTGTFGKVEYEIAAALMILACRDLGSWGPVTFGAIRQSVKSRAGSPEFPWFTNPFCVPDFDGLVAKKFAAYRPGNAIEFTPSGLAQLKRWARRPRGFRD